MYCSNEESHAKARETDHIKGNFEVASIKDADK